MAKILKELETRVTRTYRGGKLLDEFLGKETGADTFFPEDWISSFIEAKNKNYIPGEGITRIAGGGLITDAVTPSAFGQGRTQPGVLIKLLDASERLGIQVHPNDAFAQKTFGSPHGKTECWHILKTRCISDKKPRVYLGFRPHITRQIWEDCYRRQDVAAMLAGMYEIEVRPRDTILVCGGMPHAIGGGCLLLEIQQPSDYTMRCERVPLSGDPYTPQQIHYGAGEQAMLDCFDYTPRTRQEIEERFILRPRRSVFPDHIRTDYITYEDTPLFSLAEIEAKNCRLCEPCFVTLVCLRSGGAIRCEEEAFSLSRGDRFFIPANTPVTCHDCNVLICYPPKV